MLVGNDPIKGWDDAWFVWGHLTVIPIRTLMHKLLKERESYALGRRGSSATTPRPA